MRELKLFISSTFLDMEYERDYLQKHVFDIIGAACAKRGINFIPLELRWGIDSSKGKEHVLSTCLEQISESRPFFIGIIGDRYGSTYKELDGDSIANGKNNSTLPPHMSNQYPWLQKDIDENLSITEIEMNCGAFRDSNRKAFFYIKISNSGNDNETPEKQNRLQLLREKVRSQNIHKVSEYDSPNSLGEAILSDVLSEIEVLFPIDGDKTDYTFFHNYSFENRCSSLYDISESFPLIENELKEKNTQVIRIQGEKGSGKSVYLCNLLSHIEQTSRVHTIYYDASYAAQGEYRTNGIVDFHEYVIRKIYESLGWKYKAIDDKSIFWWKWNSFILGIKERYQLIWRLLFAKDISSTYAQEIGKITNKSLMMETEKRISDILKQYNKIARCSESFIVGFDNIEHWSLNKLQLTSDFDILPNNVSILYTANSETPSWHHKKEYITVIPQLDDVAKRKKLITGYFKRFGKEDLPEERIALFAKACFANNPASLVSIMNYLVHFGAYQKIDDEINRLCSITSQDGLFAEKVKQFLLLYDNTNGSNPGRLAICAIALSELGLSPNEILEICQIKQIEWYRIEAQINAICSIEENRLFLSKKESAIALSLSTEEDKETILSRMITFFSSLIRYRTQGDTKNNYIDVCTLMDDETLMTRQAKELPKLLVTSHQYDELVYYISSIPHDECLSEAERLEYWTLLFKEGYLIKDNITEQWLTAPKMYCQYYMGVSEDEIESEKRAILGPNEDDYVHYLERLYKVALTCGSSADTEALSSRLFRKMDIDSFDDPEIRTIYHVNQLMSSRAYSELLLFSESQEFQQIEDTIYKQSIRAIALFFLNQYNGAEYILKSLLNEKYNALLYSYGAPYFMFVTGLLLLNNPDNKEVAQKAYCFASPLYEEYNTSQYAIPTENMAMVFWGFAIVSTILLKDNLLPLYNKTYAVLVQLYGEDSDFAKSIKTIRDQYTSEMKS